MASGTSTANSTSGTSLTPQANGASRPTNKYSGNMKTSEGGRKQTSSPVDGSQKRPPVPKAWTSSINPITQKTTQPQSNGNISQQSNIAPKGGSKLLGADKDANDRLNFILGASTGNLVSILTASGEAYEGVLVQSALDNGNSKMIIKMAKRKSVANDTRANGDMSSSSAFTGSGPDFSMTFEAKDVAEVSLPLLNLPEPAKAKNGANSRFRTDADISRASLRNDRPLQRWVPDSTEGADMSLESSGTGEWDQFEANNRLFGTNSSFDEHLYTTRIDRSAPSYKERERQAARLAREIESSGSNNAHIQEERGQAMENDAGDEEDKYSGVRRDDVNFPPLKSGLGNKYTPPARRAPTALPTVAGAPVDPAIISAQLSKPENTSSSQMKSDLPPKSETSRSPDKDKASKQDASPLDPEPIDRSVMKAQPSHAAHLQSSQVKGKEKAPTSTTGTVPQRNMPGNATDGVEEKLLVDFRQFAAAEKMKIHQSQRSRATNDRATRIKELQSFSKSFKLRTPVPQDLVPILAKDPDKQEAIVASAQKDSEEKISPPPVKPVATIPAESKVSTKPKLQKFDASMVPGPIPELTRGRQGAPGPRSDRPAVVPQGGRGGQGFGGHRAGGNTLERQRGPPQNIVPAPIPIHESQIGPLGPVGDSTLSSPHRSTVHTPTSAISTKFNAKALEFKPNATAPSFTPAAPSIPTPSPQPIQASRSVSGRASPHSFFGTKKPKPASERPDFTKYFNPFPRLKKEADAQKEVTKKDYSSNGGILPAFNTAPRWDVSEQYQDRTYLEVFDKMMAIRASPAPTNRSMSSNHHIPYQQQIPYHMQPGGHNMMGHGPPSHHVQHNPVPHQANHFDNDHGRTHMGGSAQAYNSPRLGAGQMVYPSPMGHPTPMPYGQPPGQYMQPPGGPSPMQMRQYGGPSQYMPPQTPQMGAPMMAHQHSSGPYMGLPQQPYPQMPTMYSPNPQQVYPHQGGSQPHSGFPSPSRTAPMMMHQGSQQGPHGGQHGYGMPGHPNQMGYGQSQPMRGGYTAQHTLYGSSPGQNFHYPQRTMSSGYGGQYHGKGPMQHVQSNQGPPMMNGVQGQGGYPPQDGPMDLGK